MVQVVQGLKASMGKESEEKEKKTESKSSGLKP